MKKNINLTVYSGGALVYFVILILVLLASSVATLSMTLLPLRSSTDNLRQYNTVESAVISHMNYALGYIQGVSEISGQKIFNYKNIVNNDGEYVISRTENGITANIRYVASDVENIYSIQVDACSLNSDLCLNYSKDILISFNSGLPIRPETPITTAGSAINITGYSKIINPLGQKIASLASGVAVPTGATIQYQNNTTTKTGNDLDVSDYSDMFIEGVIYPPKDPHNVDAYNSAVFAQMFGLDYNETIASADRTTANANDLDNVTDELIYFTNQLDISANKTIGSPDAPVFLIVNGALNLSAGVQIYGYVFVRGAFNSSANTHITGGLFLANSMPYAVGVNLSGGNDFNSNPFVLTYQDYSEMSAVGALVGESGSVVVTPLVGSGILR